MDRRDDVPIGTSVSGSTAAATGTSGDGTPMEDVGGEGQVDGSFGGGDGGEIMVEVVGSDVFVDGFASHGGGGGGEDSTCEAGRDGLGKEGGMKRGTEAFEASVGVNDDLGEEEEEHGDDLEKASAVQEEAVAVENDERNPGINDEVDEISPLQAIEKETVVVGEEHLNTKDEISVTGFEKASLPPKFDFGGEAGVSEKEEILQSKVDFGGEAGVIVKEEILHSKVDFGREAAVIEKEENLHSEVEAMETDVSCQNKLDSVEEAAMKNAGDGEVAAANEGSSIPDVDSIKDIHLDNCGGKISGSSDLTAASEHTQIEFSDQQGKGDDGGEIGVLEKEEVSKSSFECTQVEFSDQQGKADDGGEIGVLEKEEVSKSSFEHTQVEFSDYEGKADGGGDIGVLEKEEVSKSSFEHTQVEFSDQQGKVDDGGEIGVLEKEEVSKSSFEHTQVEFSDQQGKVDDGGEIGVLEKEEVSKSSFEHTQVEFSDQHGKVDDEGVIGVLDNEDLHKSSVEHTQVEFSDQQGKVDDEGEIGALEKEDVSKSLVENTQVEFSDQQGKVDDEGEIGVLEKEEFSKSSVEHTQVEFFDQQAKVDDGGDVRIVEREEIMHSKVEVMQTDVSGQNELYSVEEEDWMKVDMGGEGAVNRGEAAKDGGNGDVTDVAAANDVSSIPDVTVASDSTIENTQVVLDSVVTERKVSVCDGEEILKAENGRICAVDGSLESADIQDSKVDNLDKGSKTGIPVPTEPDSSIIQTTVHDNQVRNMDDDVSCLNTNDTDEIITCPDASFEQSCVAERVEVAAMDDIQAVDFKDEGSGDEIIPSQNKTSESFCGDTSLEHSCPDASLEQSRVSEGVEASAMDDKQALHFKEEVHGDEDVNENVRIAENDLHSNVEHSRSDASLGQSCVDERVEASAMDDEQALDFKEVPGDEDANENVRIADNGLRFDGEHSCPDASLEQSGVDERVEASAMDDEQALVFKEEVRGDEDANENVRMAENDLHSNIEHSCPDASLEQSCVDERVEASAMDDEQALDFDEVCGDEGGNENVSIAENDLHSNVEHSCPDASLEQSCVAERGEASALDNEQELDFKEVHGDEDANENVRIAENDLHLNVEDGVAEDQVPKSVAEADSNTDQTILDYLEFDSCNKTNLYLPEVNENLKSEPVMCSTADENQAILVAGEDEPVSSTRLPDGNENREENLANNDSSSLEKQAMGSSEGLNQPIDTNVESFQTEHDHNIVHSHVPVAMDFEVVQEVEFDDKYPESEWVDSHGDQETEINQGPENLVDGHQSSYLLPPDNEGEFSVSDLVWGKVRSHPWWPGQIFDPADASETANKHHKKDSFLVAYFGDHTFAWNDSSLLKPFRPHFFQVAKQSNSDAFQNAVNCALEEVSRRVELGLACSCMPEDAYNNIESQSIENAGIREESSRRFGVDRSTGANCFEPVKLLEYVRALAMSPSNGLDRLDLVIAKAQLSALCHLKGYELLPGIQFCGELMEDNVETHKRKHDLNDSLYPSKKERNLSELGDATHSSESEDGLDGKVTNQSVSSSSGQKRKATDSGNEGSDKRMSFYAAKVSTTVPSIPKPSFKVGDCIRRVATQLTADNNRQDSLPQTNMVIDQAENSSLDEILSQLRFFATNPKSGFTFSSNIMTFLSGFRSSVVASQHSGRRVSSMGRIAGARKKKIANAAFGSPEEFEFDDVNDSYWTDMIIQNYSEEQLLDNCANRERHYQPVALEPDKSRRRPYNRKRYSGENHEMGAETEYADGRRQDLPAELILNFKEGDPVPSEINLNKIFRRFGPLMESETEVDRDTWRARVVYKKGSDAEVACSSAAKFSIFGPMLVNYQLSYSPSISLTTLPVALSHGANDAS